MTNKEYYNKVELLLENHITQIKKASFLFPDSDRLIKNLSGLIVKTRELKKGSIPVEDLGKSYILHDEAREEMMLDLEKGMPNGS